MAQTATKTLADELPPDPFAWQPDPVVVVSRRNRVLAYPADLVKGDPTPEQVKRWTNPEARAEHRNDKMLALIAGVNFIGCRTSSWAYLHTQQGQQPQGPPQDSQQVLVWPQMSQHADISNPRSGNVDRETGRLRPDKVQAIVMRILDYIQARVQPDLWTTPDGYDAPELMMMPLSQVLQQKGDAGQQAHEVAHKAISGQYLRRMPIEVMTPLGALHDYAMRIRGGAGIVTVCRQWAQRKKVG